jgi:hypothetical protein
VDSLSNQPLPAARVTIYASENPEYSQRVVTGADGRFLFPAVPAGKYTLTGSGQGYRSQGYHQHGDYFVGIAAGPDLDSEHITFRLVADARIEGSVTDEDGEPVRNANVQLFQRNHETGRQSTRQITGAVTDDRGHYIFSHLAPGAYFVAVSARPWYAQYPNPGEPPPDAENATRVADERAQLDVAYPLTFYPSTDDSSAATALVVRPGDRVNADIALRAVPAVHLRVRTADSHEQPAGGARAQVFPRVSQRIFEGTLVPVMTSQAFAYSGSGLESGAGSAARVQRSQNGGMEYTGIAPGHYVIEMTGGGKQTGWYKEIDLSGTVEIDASENPPLASVSGSLSLEGASRPVGRIFVILANRLTSETIAAEVTPKGTFDFTEMEVRPGRYDLLLNIDGSFQIRDIAARGARVTGKTLEISGGNVQLAVTATRALARVNGIVLRDQQPFPGAMVVLVPRNPVSDFILFRRDESDSDGTFSLRDVLPGAYTVIALENGWELDWANPATLQPYLKQGIAVDVSGETKLSVKVPLQ